MTRGFRYSKQKKEVYPHPPSGYKAFEATKDVSPFGYHAISKSTKRLDQIVPFFFSSSLMLVYFSGFLSFFFFWKHERFDNSFQP